MKPYIFLLVLAGCFERIAPDKPDASLADSGPLGRYTTTRGSDGTYTTIIDSTSATDWTYGDFETGMESVATGPWDLRFQRFHISTNGGISGSGGVEVAPVPGVTFAQLTSAPSMGWTSDADDGDDANTDPDYAFEQGDGWYDYNPMTHVLTPKSLVWAMKTAGGSTLKLEITRYYDDAGTAGWFTLHWSPL
jgi:hypothetical protein